MEGDRGKRFCGECKMNVYNLSELSESDLEEVLDRRERERTCVYMRRGDDGRIIFENCPVMLRSARDRIFKTALNLALIAAWSIALSADAQHLVGAPVDPRYGSGAEVGQLADFGYDTARDISRGITFLSFVLVALWPVKKETRNNARKMLLTVIARLAVPFFVHLAGTFAINNYGGLGGGL